MRVSGGPDGPVSRGGSAGSAVEDGTDETRRLVRRRPGNPAAVILFAVSESLGFNG